MTRLEKVLSFYFASTRPCPRVDPAADSAHARRLALVRGGKMKQAAAIGGHKQATESRRNRPGK